MIQFRSTARKEAVSQHSLRVLDRICIAAKIPVLWVSSTQRLAAEQARAMYNNLEATSVNQQKSLYALAGREVIAVYVSAKGRGLSPDEIKAEMEAAIVRIGPSRVSRHCANPAILNVLDIPPSTMTAAQQRAFKVAVEAELKRGTVTKFLHPPTDPAFHLEIPQTEALS